MIVYVTARKTETNHICDFVQNSYTCKIFVTSCKIAICIFNKDPPLFIKATIFVTSCEIAIR